MKQKRYTTGSTTETYGGAKKNAVPEEGRSGKKAVICAAVTLLSIQCFSVAAFATTDSVTAPFFNLQSLAGSIVSAIGYIITLFGISEWGVSFGEAQGVMQAQSLKRIGGGFIMILAPQILTILTA